MQLIFDASTQVFDAWWQAIFPVAALVGTIYAFVREARTWVRWGGVALTFLMFYVAIVGPIIDLQHVQTVMREGRTKTVEGPISMHSRVTTKRWSGDSKGVGITTTRRYTTSTSEQFFVGKQWFWLRVDGYGSNASFTNSANPPVLLRDGMMAKVTWFEDSWNDNETRIVRLELGPEPGGLSGAAHIGKTRRVPLAAGASSDREFSAFWQRFSKAAAAGDKRGVATLTRFPFLFAGTPMDRERFDSIWMGIFPEPLRSCFSTAIPMRDGGAMSVSCGAYVYVFEKDASGWRLASFTAEGEAM